MTSVGTRLERLAPAEGEQPAGEVGAALGRHADRFGERAQLSSVELVGEHVGIEQDRGEQIVEVVRDAAGELADRLHALRLRELRLGALLFGDVGRGSSRPTRPCPAAS